METLTRDDMILLSTLLRVRIATMALAGSNDEANHQQQLQALAEKLDRMEQALFEQHQGPAPVNPEAAVLFESLTKDDHVA